jgi:ABC-type amino acid transport substrate-binding protein
MSGRPSLRGSDNAEVAFPVREECHGQGIARLLPALESGSIDMIVSNMTMTPDPRRNG